MEDLGDEETYARFICVDCSANTADTDEYYMVHDHVWLSSGMTLHGGMLCIGCLEQRLGRELTRPDFTDAPINHGFFNLSTRIAERMKAA